MKKSFLAFASALLLSPLAEAVSVEITSCTQDADTKRVTVAYTLFDGPAIVTFSLTDGSGAALPADTPDPVITGCRPVTVDGINYLELTLKRTVHYLDYDLAKGSTPAMADETGDAAKAPVSGSAADDPNEPVKVLVPADGSSGFFRAIRHGQRVCGGEQEGGKAQ